MSSLMIKNLLKPVKKDKKKNIPHTDVRTINAVHQADILYLPSDNGYKYVLVVADLATRLFDAEPLRKKDSNTVLKAFKKIYNRNILNLPKRLEVDSGNEFMGQVKKYFKDNKIFIRVSKIGRHRQNAVVERKNQLLSVMIFERQLEQELITGERDRRWVKDLPNYVKILNDQTKNTWKMKDKNNYGDPVCKGDACKLLDEGTKVRVALDNPYDIPTKKTLPGKFRSTDIRWDPKVRVIKRVMIYPDKPPLYLLDGNKGLDGVDFSAAYTKNQLFVIPKNEIGPRVSSLRGPAVKKYK